MQGYFIFLFIAFLFTVIAEITREKGFDNLTIKRHADKYLLHPGEEFKMTTVLENKKWLPVSFLYVEEEIPSEIIRGSSQVYDTRGVFNYFINSYSVLWNERIIRTYTAKVDKRGVYLMRKMNIAIGDVFGLAYENKSVEDAMEIVVFPKIRPLKSILLQNNSTQGESIVKRWIYKDPLYIKGIREYNIEDRMKDIHWKSSLRMNKLMVKDYDYTSEREMVIILNVQAGEPYWSAINSEAVERSVEVAVALAQQAIDDGVPTGMWTNSQVLNYSGDFKSEVLPSLNSFRGILELCGRVDYHSRVEFSSFISSRATEFNRNTIYAVITPYLNEQIITIMQRLKRMGILIKLIDTSEGSSLPGVDGIEKINCGGGFGDEFI